MQSELEPKALMPLRGKAIPVCIGTAIQKFWRYYAEYTCRYQFSELCRTIPAPKLSVADNFKSIRSEPSAKASMCVKLNSQHRATIVCSAFTNESF